MHAHTYTYTHIYMHTDTNILLIRHNTYMDTVIAYKIQITISCKLTRGFLHQLPPPICDTEWYHIYSHVFVLALNELFNSVDVLFKCRLLPFLFLVSSLVLQGIVTITVTLAAKILLMFAFSSTCRNTMSPQCHRFITTDKTPNILNISCCPNPDFIPSLVV